jgi:hypothetical protein
LAKQIFPRRKSARAEKFPRKRSLLGEFLEGGKGKGFKKVSLFTSLILFSSEVARKTARAVAFSRAFRASLNFSKFFGFSSNSERLEGERPSFFCRVLELHHR